MASTKIKRTKIMHIINDNAVRGSLSENYLIRKFIARNICDAKYSQFTVFGFDNYMNFSELSINRLRKSSAANSAYVCQLGNHYGQL